MLPCCHPDLSILHLAPLGYAAARGASTGGILAGTTVLDGVSWHTDCEPLGLCPGSPRTGYSATVNGFSDMLDGQRGIRFCIPNSLGFAPTSITVQRRNSGASPAFSRAGFTAGGTAAYSFIQALPPAAQPARSITTANVYVNETYTLTGIPALVNSLNGFCIGA